MLSISQCDQKYCYRLVSLITLIQMEKSQTTLLYVMYIPISIAYCFHVVNVISLSSYSLCYQFIFIQLMLSVILCPKVITFSGFDCFTNFCSIFEKQLKVKMIQQAVKRNLIFRQISEKINFKNKINFTLKSFWSTNNNKVGIISANY